MSATIVHQKESGMDLKGLEMCSHPAMSEPSALCSVSVAAPPVHAMSIFASTCRYPRSKSPLSEEDEGGEHEDSDGEEENIITRMSRTRVGGPGYHLNLA